MDLDTLVAETERQIGVEASIHGTSIREIVIIVLALLFLETEEKPWTQAPVR